MCPITTAHGCANGDAGAPKTNTALAPIDATNTNPSPPCTKRAEIRPVKKMPAATPTTGAQRTHPPPDTPPTPNTSPRRRHSMQNPHFLPPNAPDDIIFKPISCIVFCVCCIVFNASICFGERKPPACCTTCPAWLS